MTTLPQNTSPSRVTRPSVPDSAMAMSHGGLAAPAAPIMTGADAWRIIRANWILITVCLILSVALGIVANMILTRTIPKFTATGWVQVSPNFVFDPLKPVSMPPDKNAIEIEQRTQASLMGDPGLFDRVLQKSEVQATKWFQSFNSPEDRREALDKQFSASPIIDTKLISASMTTDDAKEARIICIAIVDQHIANQQNISQNRSLSRSQALNRIKDAVRLKLEDRSRDLRELQVAIYSAGGGAPGMPGPKDMELSEMVKRQLELKADADLADASLRQVKTAMTNGTEPPGLGEYMAKGGDPSVAMYRQQLDQVEYQISALGITVGTDGSRIQQLTQQKSFLRGKLDDATAEASSKAKSAMISDLESQSTAAQLQLKGVMERIDALRQELGQLKKDQVRYLELQDDIEKYSEQNRDIDDQLTQIGESQKQLEQAGVFWASQPQTPDKLSFPKMRNTVAIAVFLGLALSLSIAFLRELLNTTVRSPRDVARVGHMSLLGMIPDVEEDEQAKAVRLPVVIAEAPGSMMAESFRELRTRLQHCASLDTLRSIMVTSPSPDEGKTTVVCNLAVGLALNGRRILLVDANFRRPAIHAVFGIPNDSGFANALGDPTQFSAMVRETQIPNLSVMPAGTKPANATELLESPLLLDFIDKALDEYDHVLFDTGPILFVSDTVAMAPRVDGVVTVVKARGVSRGVLQRTRDLLRQLKAENLGVVLMGVKSMGGGYYSQNIKTYYDYQLGAGRNGQS